MIELADVQAAFEKVNGVLDDIAEVKMPPMRSREDAEELLGPRERIDQLESHLLLTARARQEAHHAKLSVQRALDVLEDDWGDMEGWEIGLPNGKRTRETVLDAKRQMNPSLFKTIQSGKRLVDRMDEQIKRLERDGDVASRLYTFIAGA